MTLSVPPEELEAADGLVDIALTLLQRATAVILPRSYTRVKLIPCSLAQLMLY